MSKKKKKVIKNKMKNEDVIEWRDLQFGIDKILAKCTHRNAKGTKSSIVVVDEETNCVKCTECGCSFNVIDDLDEFYEVCNNMLDAIQTFKMIAPDDRYLNKYIKMMPHIKHLFKDFKQISNDKSNKKEAQKIVPAKEKYKARNNRDIKIVGFADREKQV